METSDLANLIKSRRSIRIWQDKKVAKEVLLKAIEIATYAPNGGNKQNWRFYVIMDKSTISAIADAVQASADYIAANCEVGEFGDEVARMVKKSSFFRSAPAAIAVAAGLYKSPIDQLLAEQKKPNARCVQIRQWRSTSATGLQSASSAIAYLLLVLHQMGLGAVWMTGPLQAKGDIDKILKVPQNMNLVAFIPVGYPAENPPLKGRKPVEEVCEIVE